MKLRRLAYGFSTLVLSLSSLVVLVAPVAHAAGNTCDWSGAVDTSFSTAGNWNNCGGVAPTVSDTLKFTSLGAGNSTNTLTNDLGHDVAGMVIDATTSGSYPTYVINTLSFADGAIVDSTTANASGGSTSVYVGSDISTLSPVTASGSITFLGNYNYLHASVFNAVGTVTLTTGISFFDTVSAANLIVENGANVYFDASSSTPSLSVPLTLGGGVGTGAPIITFNAVCVSGGMGCSYNPATWTVSSPITLNHDALVYSGTKSTVNITGSISGPGYKLSMDGSSYGTVNINPSSNDSNTVAGTQAVVITTNTLSDNLPTTDLSIPNNTIDILDGTRNNVYVGNGATLKGNGTVNGSLSVYGGTVAPGHSPGCINSGNTVIAGTYQVEIGGTTACSGYDQLNVTGTVTLDDGGTPPTSGILDVSQYNGFTPAVGDTFIIIKNDGSDAVSGTFQGLAEGATVTSTNGVTYTISYKGGDGNDVVLTAVATTTATTPDTGFEHFANNPLATLVGTFVIVAAVSLIARRQLKNNK